jgi:hypothetical protein
MTSKRLGIAIAAVFVLWSLAGFGWLSQTPIDGTEGVFLVGIAHAGDPDMYEGPSGTDGDSGESSDGEEPPPPSQDEDTDSRTDDVEQTIATIVSLILWGICGP